MSKNSGFTIIELLIALLIAGIIFGSAQLYLRKMLWQNRIRSTTAELRALIDHHDNLARLSGYDLSLRFDRVQHKVWLASARQENPERLVFKTPKGISIEHASFGNLSLGKETLSLRANGTLSPGTVRLSNGSHSCSLIQALRGARRIECSF